MSSQQAAVVPQASILAVAKGIASKVTPNAMTFGLAVDVYEDMAVTGYNHFWLQKIEKNEDCLAEFTSKHKLDVLVRVGALQVGDELFVNPEHTDENGVVVFSGERAAKITKIGKGSLPEFDLFFMGAKVKEFGPCSGPKDIANALKELEPALGDDQLNLRKPWAALWMRRRQVPMISVNPKPLYDVRQSVHRWQIELAAYNAWKNQNDVDS